MERTETDQTRAPIYEALEKFREMRVVPFDVPGHKHGKGNPELTAFLGEKCVGVDVNSMKPLDNLCHPVSVIRQAEDLAAEAFGASHAFLMVGGTTSSVQSMVLSCCKHGDKIILPRNVHRSVINALVLCGAIPVYVNPEVDQRLGISLGMSRDQVKKAIEENPDAVAVLVNNPTYYGICSDIRSIVKMAHDAGMLCLADEAHGTHFYFGESMPLSAMRAGADMSAVSMHKSGGSLTQSSLLLIGENVPEVLSCDLRLEKGAQETVKEGIAYCESVRDYVSRDLLQDILNDTKEHIDWLETQIELVGRVDSGNDRYGVPHAPKRPRRSKGRKRPPRRLRKPKIRWRLCWPTARIPPCWIS